MIIGFVGPFCSGKDVAGKILEEKGFKMISLGDLIREDMKKEGIELTRKNIQDYVREMRKKFGQQYPADKVAGMIEEGKNYVVQGFRNPNEGKELKKLKDFVLVVVDAPEEIRFERMKERNRENDPVTFEEFKKIEEMELHGKGEGGFGFNIKAVMSMADKTIVNDGTFKDLEKKLDELLEELRESQ